jgi:metal-sulfur cluster biosynthetic enzyme
MPTPTEDQIMEALREVNDPELFINVVDLGLIYDVQIEGGRVDVTMTLTTPACPMNQYIGGQVEEALKDVPGVEKVGVNIVWSPPWNPELMSEDAKLELGFV